MTLRPSRAGHVAGAVMAAVVLAPAAASAAEARDALDRATDMLASAARLSPAAERETAAKALELLTPLSAMEDASCRTLVLTAEAALRAERPDDARSVVHRAQEMACLPGVVLQLHGWLLEFNDEGVRRGPGAALESADRSYEQAALAFLAMEPPENDLAVSALATSAEVAAAREAWDRCRVMALRALRTGSNRPAQVALGGILLRCGSRVEGEGASLEWLSRLADDAVVMDVVQGRMEELKGWETAGIDDATVAASLATYGLLAGQQTDLLLARRQLLKAAALDETLPDLWYLFGQVEEGLGNLRAAISSYRKQLELHPAQRASRLAANNLAHALAELPGTPEELAEALRVIDLELIREPEEAAMHDTRARVLRALGRNDEALAAMERSVELSEDPAAARVELQRWRRGFRAAQP